MFIPILIITLIVALVILVMIRVIKSHEYGKFMYQSDDDSGIQVFYIKKRFMSFYFRMDRTEFFFDQHDAVLRCNELNQKYKDDRKHKKSLPPRPE